MSLVIGVPTEIKNNEYRVALTPDGVRELTHRGLRVLVQAGAGANSELPDGDYPGEDAAQEKADTFCTAEFKTFVGVATKDSSLDRFYMYPVKESWATGDREVLCFAGLDKGGLKGSLKGTKK